MVPLSEFKKALGELAQHLSDAEIEQIRDTQDRIADVLFDAWLRETNPHELLHYPRKRVRI